MARSTSDPRLTFRCLHHDELSGLTREFQLRYYFDDSTVDMTDINTKKLFLKRTEAKNLDVSDFVIGKKVVVFGRLLHLCEYLDIVTQQLCEAGIRTSSVAGVPVSQREDAKSSQPRCYDSCYVVVDASRYFPKLGTVLSVLDVELGLTITGITVGTLPSKALQSAISAEKQYSALFPIDGSVSQLQSVSGKIVCVFRVARPNLGDRVSEIFRRLSLSGNSQRSGGLFAFATVTAPQISPVVGTAPQHPLEVIYDGVAQRTAKRLQSGAASGTIVVIKPHILVRREAGDVLQWLLDQSQGSAVVDAVCLLSLTTNDASKLLAAYRGVLPDYAATVSQLSAGASIAVHLCSAATAVANASADSYRDGNPCDASDAATNNGAVGECENDEKVFHGVRALCGPYDPAIAKAIRPVTLRARYGINRAENAVHCCDDVAEVCLMSGWLWGVVAARKSAHPGSEAS